MSFLMFRSCMKEYGLICFIESSSSCNTWRQWKACNQIKNHYLTSRYFSGNGNVRANIARKWPPAFGSQKLIGNEKRYQLMLENLKAESDQFVGFKNFKKGEKTIEPKDTAKDGVINELVSVPPVVHALVPSLFPRYCKHSRKLDNHEFILEVGQPLRTSIAYDHLCIRLKVPYKYGEGFQGHKALLRLCHAARRQGDSLYKYSTDTESINEVFKVAGHNVNIIGNQDLMDLLYYRYIVKDFSGSCYMKLFMAFVQAIRNNSIHSNDLINFIIRLGECDTSNLSNLELKDFETLRKSIGYCLAMESCRTFGILKQVYRVIPTKHNSIFLLLNKALMKNLDKLDVSDVILIHKEIHNRPNCKDVGKKLSSWIDKNCDKALFTDIENMMPDLIVSQYRNNALVSLFDKLLLSTPIKDISTTNLMQILSYCTIAKFYNDSVLETACDHYIEDQDGYNTEQLHILLKAIGTLKFLPARYEDFFNKVELHLLNNFDNMDVLTVLEMVVYLIYLDRFSLNLLDHIFRDQFLNTISGLKQEERVIAERCYRIIYRESSLISEMNHLLTLTVDPTLQWMNNDTSCYDKILPVFVGIIQHEGKVNVRCKPTGSGTYIEVNLNDIAKSYGIKKDFGDDKLAFMVMTEDSFCKNKGFTQHMMGEEMANIRILQEEGATVVWTPADKVKDLVAQKSLSAFIRKLMLKLIKT